MSFFNIIGDVAGRYLTLQALLKKMPEGEPISVGDMIDRGPRSKEVVKFFMNNGRAIFGNHEHLMLDHLRQPEMFLEGMDNKRFYERGTWTVTGGNKTLESFDMPIPEYVLQWASRLPKFLEIGGCLVSHAFVSPQYTTAQEACFLGNDAMDWRCDISIIWNRDEPIPRKEYDLQIAGHNSFMGLRWFKENEKDYGVCIDTSKQKILTGIHLPNRTIYQQEYID